MAITNPVASSRPTRRIFERTETCHTPSDIGTEPNRRLQNKGLAKYAKARRHYAPARERAAEYAPQRSAAPRRTDIGPIDDIDTRAELPSRGHEAARAVGDILILAVSLGAILSAAVIVAAGLAYLFII
jgi:hypothetical protein